MMHRNTTQNRHDGSRPTPPTQSWLESQANQQEMASVIRELVNPGKDVSHLLMRTILPTEEKATAAVILLHKFERFKMSDKYAKLVQNKLASFCSIEGMSRRELVMAQTGVVSHALYKVKQPKDHNDKQNKKEDE